MNVQSRTAGTDGPALLRERDGDLAVLTLNRPAARNSLSEALLGALSAAFSEIAADTSIRAVVVAANGPAFCAGHDLKELTARRGDADGGRAYFRHIMNVCSAMMQQIVTLPQPVIAAVQGVASAAGCQLVASCDLAVAAEDARFATSGINVGLFCSTPMVALSRAVGRKAAMEMLLTGDFIDAATALAWGLVNHVVPREALRRETDALAHKICEKSALAVSLGKTAFYRQIEMDLSAAYAYTSEVMTRNMLSHDAPEGIDAFIAKRKPVWHDE